jgi:ribonuclease BN (tRNA processing enzyme)
MMEIVILGSGTGIPTKRRGSPGLILRNKGKDILIDSGSGTLQKLASAGIPFEKQEDIFYTHLHPDHCADLVPILFAKRNPDISNSHELNLWGGKGFKNYVDKLMSIYEKWIVPENYRLNVYEIGDPVELGPFKFVPIPVMHIESSIGFRIEVEGNKRIFISGDTDYCEKLIEGALEVDLAILECSYPDERKIQGHLTPRLAAEVARMAKCKRVLLWHFYPICDQYDIGSRCRDLFDCEVIMAEDLMHIFI